MKEVNFVILYGSQTGNSQDLAERMWRKLKSKNFPTQLSSFDKFDLNKLFNAENNVSLVCVCSTTGQGDVPDNMLNFWRTIMRKSIPNDFLRGLQFFLIGLGDPTYEKFNFTAKKLFKRLIQLGASSPLDACLCDEQQTDGIEGTFARWMQRFWQVLDNPTATVETKSISKYKLIYESSSLSSDLRELNSDREEVNEINPYRARLLTNKRVTSEDHWQDVRLIELDCGRLKYECGDVLMLRPSNLKQNVDKFTQIFQHLTWNLQQPIEIVANYEHEIECETEINRNLIKTVGDLLERYFDFNSVPRMSFFEMFAQLATDELEKEKLEEFLSPEGLDDLYTYCYRPRRSILEIFYDFPQTSKNIKSLETLLDLIPSIKPRSFSIASSPRLHGDKLQILVAVVEYKTRLYETRKGTCSYWLASLSDDDASTSDEIYIPVWIKNGSFKVDPKWPIVCIGPGTGVAPFRSIINERISTDPSTQNHLYFGCRSKHKDYYFESEWTSLHARYGAQTFNVYAAFSRDQSEKIYVQDVLLQNERQVFDLIHNKNGYVLIAGSSKRMPEDVLAMLEKIFAMSLFQNEPDPQACAKSYIKNLENQKRIQLETWS